MELASYEPPSWPLLKRESPCSSGDEPHWSRRQPPPQWMPVSPPPPLRPVPALQCSETLTQYDDLSEEVVSRTAPVRRRKATPRRTGRRGEIRGKAIRKKSRG